MAFACGVFREGLTPRLTGAGARSAEGTNTGHENAEGMASVGVRVEPIVRLGRVGRARQVHSSHGQFPTPAMLMPVALLYAVAGFGVLTQ